jgi:hypothetical protein
VQGKQQCDQQQDCYQDRVPDTPAEPGCLNSDLDLGEEPPGLPGFDHPALASGLDPSASTNPCPDQPSPSAQCRLGPAFRTHSPEALQQGRREASEGNCGDATITVEDTTDDDVPATQLAGEFPALREGMPPGDEPFSPISVAGISGRGIVDGGEGLPGGGKNTPNGGTTSPSGGEGAFGGGNAPPSSAEKRVVRKGESPARGSIRHRQKRHRPSGSPQRTKHQAEKRGRDGGGEEIPTKRKSSAGQFATATGSVPVVDAGVGQGVRETGGDGPDPQLLPWEPLLSFHETAASGEVVPLPNKGAARINAVLQHCPESDASAPQDQNKDVPGGGAGTMVVGRFGTTGAPPPPFQLMTASGKPMLLREGAAAKAEAMLRSWECDDSTSLCCGGETNSMGVGQPGSMAAAPPPDHPMCATGYNPGIPHEGIAKLPQASSTSGNTIEDETPPVLGGSSGGVAHLGFQLSTASGKPLALGGAAMERARLLMADLGDIEGEKGPSESHSAAAPPALSRHSGDVFGLEFQLTTASGKSLAIGGAGMERAKRIMLDLAHTEREPLCEGLSAAPSHDPHPVPTDSPVVRPGSASARTPLAQIRNHGLGGVPRFGRDNAGPVPSRLGPAGRSSGQKAKTAFKAPRTNRKFQSPMLKVPASALKVSIPPSPRTHPQPI